ncbi:phosphoglycerate dehydrogenase [Mobilicoccus pelagius]|uniref:D-3-phosphoglycerate dehydrogenase n=1 Tax=Mobilicoccus pelagius NBRC 104925 TaxID=1089455 RepID=H5UVR5_9MICO|nr:phosphoglycerate dehydrogenase [Mobilicoccus pelagius]GAB49823.1 D-3-phosphoglycerate dehydrogenase [Mobilicoccus pelagius NBRC 104925]
MKALLLENIHSVAVTTLEEAGFEIETRMGALDEAELVEALAGVDVLGIRSTTHVTREVLAANPQLLAVGAFCIGTNQIDLAAAASLAVPVFNAPFSNTRSVVELVLAEIILLARRLTEKDRNLHEGVWDKQAKGSHEIRGRKLGIVGYGNIGSQLSVVAEMLGMDVYFYDRDDKLALGNATRCGSLEELLDIAECITLHVDGAQSNAGFFGAEQFARMRPRSLFLNLSRGFVVDYDALRENLLSGHIAGAAVDVFPNEPRSRGDAFSSPLQGIPNVVLTPHVGGSTEEAQEDIGRFVAGKLRDYTTLGTTTLSVNAPTLTLSHTPGGVRLAHMHANTPGVMATVNAILAENDINIDGQLLATRGDYGYVVTDVSSDIPHDVVEAMRAMPETRRLRVI